MRPNHAPGAGVQTIDYACAALRKDSVALNRRRRARTDIAKAADCVRRIKASRVRVRPDEFSRSHSIAGNQLIFAALLLGYCVVASDRKCRPACANFMSPQLLR